MHIEFDYLSDGQKLSLAKSLNVAPSSSGTFRVEAKVDNLDQLLLAARVHCLSKDELYFLQSSKDFLQPLNHRNEAAAISLLLQRMPANQDTPQSSLDQITDLKDQLSKHCESLWPLFRSSDAVSSSDDGSTNPTESVPTFPGSDTPAGAFHQWAEDNGIKSAIKIASFGELRGCAATKDISPGEPILSIPKHALIYDETVRETDLGRMLSAIPDLTTDNLLIIFTLCDRFDPESRWAPFWRSLPYKYYTGLSFPPDVVSALRGTAAHLEILRGQVHLRKQYEATKPLLDILLKAYPQYLEPYWFDYEQYLWATELFYSYAFEIEFPPNPKSKTVMVPFACHVNHSPWPQVVRYGRINPDTDTLDYPAFRPCTTGEQVFISYGPVPNMKLITYYGFTIRNNPHDLVPLTLEAPKGGLSAQQKAAMDKYGISMEHSLRNGPLSAQLLACLRLVVATPKEVALVTSGKKNPLEGSLSAACEAQALDTLAVALKGLLDPVQEGLKRMEERGKRKDGDSVEVNENGFDADWRMSLEFCRVYMEGQRDIFERSIKEVKKLKNAI